MHDTSTAMQDKPLRSTFWNISSSTFMLSSNDCYLLIEVVIFRLRNPRNSVRLFFSPLVSSNFVRHGCYIWTLYTCSARKRDHVLHGLWTWRKNAAISTRVLQRDLYLLIFLLVLVLEGRVRRSPLSPTFTSAVRVPRPLTLTRLQLPSETPHCSNYHNGICVISGSVL